MIKKELQLILLLGLLFICLCGCSATSSELYQSMENGNAEAYDQVLDNAEQSVENKEKEFEKQMQRKYKYLQTMAPYIMVFCIVIGLLIAVLAKKNNGMRRFAIFGIMFGGVMITIIIVYGFGYFCSIFQ